MLAAMEDLLDSWPGTLIVVSHDRYLLERVTDQQYAILDHRLRHVPGGVDEYLRLRAGGGAAGSASGGAGSAGGAGGSGGSGGSGVGGAGSSAGADSADESGSAAPKLSGAERRAATKEVSAIERKMEKLSSRIDALHADMAAHDQSDFEGLAALTAQVRELEDENAALEERWLEATEALET